jgi:hypothetical protein
MKDFAPLLLGGDLRSLARTHEVVKAVHDQETFDDLFTLLFHHERLLVMRAADAVEKITLSHPHFLFPHKKQLLNLLKSRTNKEVKWHVAQLVPRINLTQNELKEVWGVLTHQTQNPNESKIVRVDSLQALYELSQQFPEYRKQFEQALQAIEHEPYPSIQARVRKLKKLLAKTAKQ